MTNTASKTDTTNQYLSAQLCKIYAELMILPEYQRKQLIMWLVASMLTDRSLAEVLNNINAGETNA